MDVTLLDLGIGNLHSLAHALSGGDVNVRIETDPRQALESELLVLPGVGSFRAAAARLAPERTRLRAALAAGHPCIAVCLGMQLLFESSEEGECGEGERNARVCDAGVGGEVECVEDKGDAEPRDGLGLLPGRVVRLRAARVPHMGWNTVQASAPEFSVLAPPAAFYFAHGFVCPEPPGATVAHCTLGWARFPAAVRVARTLGVQFHPEKSGAEGVAFLRRAVASLTLSGSAS